MAKFEVLDADGPNWPGLPIERTRELLQALAQPDWLRAPDGRRYGFREFVEVSPGIFAGYFAVETELDYWTYEAAGPATRDQVNEFERVLAILIVRQGRWVVHERRFYRTDLGKALVRALFTEAATAAALLAGLGPIQHLRPFEQRLDDEEMLERLLTSNDRVLALRVSKLYRSHVPAAFRFFNPRYDLDEEFHTFFDENFNVLDEAELEAAPGADVRASKFAEGVARAGSVEKFQVRDTAGQKRLVRRRISPTFDLEIDIDREAFEAIVSAVVERLRELYPDRFGDVVDWTGTIFETRTEDDR